MGLRYSPAQMICAIRGSLCVVQIEIKKPSKEICDLKRVFYPSTLMIPLSSVICYKLTCLLSNQRRRQTKVLMAARVHALNNRWQCATTEGGCSICKSSEFSLGRGRLEAVLRI